jgi:hypothetical protein
MLPSKGRCLQSPYLTTGLHAKIYIGTWAHLNGVFHKSVPSACVSVCISPIVVRRNFFERVVFCAVRVVSKGRTWLVFFQEFFEFYTGLKNCPDIFLLLLLKPGGFWEASEYCSFVIRAGEMGWALSWNTLFLLRAHAHHSPPTLFNWQQRLEVVDRSTLFTLLHVNRAGSPCIGHSRALGVYVNLLWT